MRYFKIILFAGITAISTYCSYTMEEQIERLTFRVFNAEADIVEARDRAERAEKMADDLREQVRALYSVRPGR